MKKYLFILFAFIFYQANAQPFFPVRINGLWGAIDSTGKIVLKPSYRTYVSSEGEKNEFLIGYNGDTYYGHY